MMRSPGKPSSSALAADSSAEATIASRITPTASSGLWTSYILIHDPRQQVLIEASPVDADAHWFAVARRDLDHLRKLLVTLLPCPTLPGLIRYLSSTCAHSGYSDNKRWPL